MRYHSSSVKYTFIIDTVPEKKVEIRNNSSCTITFLSNGAIKVSTGRIIEICPDSDRIILDSSELYRFSEELISIDNIINIEAITY